MSSCFEMRSSYLLIKAWSDALEKLQVCMYSQWVIYGSDPAYLNNSWGLWSFLLSWGPYRISQEIGPYGAMDQWFFFFLVNCSLPPDLQLLHLCVPGHNPILWHLPWANSFGHHHRTSLTYLSGFGAHISSTWRWCCVLLGVCHPLGEKHQLDGTEGILSRLWVVTAVYMCLHHTTATAISIYKGKKLIVADAEIHIVYTVWLILPAYCKWH